MITKHRTGYPCKKGANYYLQFMVDGRWVKQALKDDKGNAITTAEEAEAARKKVMAPRMVAERETALRTVTHRLDDLVQERSATENGTPGVKLDEAWPAYLASVNRPDSGPRTLSGYEAQWRQFVERMHQTHPTRSKDFSGRRNYWKSSMGHPRSSSKLSPSMGFASISNHE